MPTDVIMPQMGESIFEGTLTKWLKKPGDKVNRDEPLFEISTDKVDAEIPAPASGVLLDQKIAEGTTVQVNTVVGTIGEAGEKPAGGAPAAAPPKAEAPKAAAPATSAGADRPTGDVSPERGAQALQQQGGAQPQAQQQVVNPAASGAGTTNAARDIRSSPLVRRMAKDNAIDLHQVPGTGMQGRITKDDIQNFISQHGKGAAAPAPPSGQRLAAAPTFAPQAPAAPSAPQAAPTFMAAGGGAPLQAPSGVQVPVWPGDRVEPMSKMRSIIAQRMVESKHTSAHVHTVFKVDMTRIVKIREKQKNSYEQRNGVKLTYMPFIARAVMAGIKAMPIVNSSVAGDSIVFHKNVNLGIAVALDWGLIVPVVKQAEEKSFLGLARGIADVAERARGKKLQPDEVQGGTFTITNPGIFGPQFGTPIINQPQVAILGMGGMFKEPVVVTDEDGSDSIAIRSIIRLTLGYDHRIIDGADADRFMVAVRKYLEGWSEEIG
jgi:2-oxoglutarate dehydrogenase E2 component (dihydrolipoamide succinyltransferase)